MAKLKEEGYTTQFLPLDVTNLASIEKVRDTIKEKHGGLNILGEKKTEIFERFKERFWFFLSVNNAGIFIVSFCVS